MENTPYTISRRNIVLSLQESRSYSMSARLVSLRPDPEDLVEISYYGVEMVPESLLAKDPTNSHRLDICTCTGEFIVAVYVTAPELEDILSYSSGHAVAIL